MGGRQVGQVVEGLVPGNPVPLREYLRGWLDISRALTGRVVLVFGQCVVGHKEKARR